MPTFFAYLDAGSASAIVSMILGGMAAIGVFLRYRWNQLLRFLKIRKPEEETPAPQAEVQPAEQREPLQTK
jgi:hypothetical protein